MESVLTWLSANWLWVLFGTVAVMKVLNKITQHWGEYTGLKRWCLFLVDLLDIVKTTPPPGVGLGRKDSGVAALDALYGMLVACVFVGLLLMGAASGCATSATGEKKFDSCSAMTAAMGGHQVAEGTASIVCAALPEPKRTVCYREAAKYKAIGQTILNLATTVIKACGL